MAGSKVALATLLFAMLLAASAVQAARPILAEGEVVAADGSLMVRDAHSRQLKTFFWPWWRFHGGCGWWNWWVCNRGFKYDDDHLDHRGRRLNFFFSRFWFFGWYKPHKFGYHYHY